MDDDCSDDSIGCCSEDPPDDIAIPMYTASGKINSDHVIHYIVIILVSKATRSLSAVQRKQPTVMADRSGVSDDVLLALQLENNAVSHTSNTAMYLPHPPATPSTAKTIEIVTEQVKLMNYK